MEKTIYQKIADAVRDANIKHIVYEEGYPMDYVKLDEELTEDEESDTISPMVRALRVITKVINAEATPEDDLRICFCHLPGEEYWGISIGDGR